MLRGNAQDGENNFIARNPSKLGLSTKESGIKGFMFISGDECDVVFYLVTKGFAVEEIKLGEKGEFVKGIYQVNKHRALKVAQKGHGKSFRVRQFLVAYDISSDIAKRALF